MPSLTTFLVSASPNHPLQEYLTSLPLPNLATVTRQETLDYFNNTWALTELLLSSLQTDSPFYLQPYHQLRHPLIFYYG
jgi:hypothetical protein